MRSPRVRASYDEDPAGDAPASGLAAGPAWSLNRRAVAVSVLWSPMTRTPAVALSVRADASGAKSPTDDAVRARLAVRGPAPARRASAWLCVSTGRAA